MLPPSSGSKNNPRKQVANSPACFLLHAGYLIGLFFDPEDDGSMSLQNVSRFSTDCMALYPRG
jgi:hypothetical protein